MAKKILKPNNYLVNLNLLEGFTILLKAYQENYSISEQHHTIRKNIQSEKEIRLEEIREKSKLIKEYFNNSFKERRENFDKMFDKLEEALKSNDTNAITVYSNMIIETVKTSPLDNIKQLIDDYNNSNIKEIEI